MFVHDWIAWHTISMDVIDFHDSCIYYVFRSRFSYLLTCPHILINDFGPAPAGLEWSR
jgi:hypothetical protein